MSQAEQGARAFGPYADTYHLARPGYPAAAVDWALDGDPATVLDLGAGTGILTAALAARGLRTIAVDPSPAMLGTLARGRRARILADARAMADAHAVAGRLAVPVRTTVLLARAPG